MAFTEDPTVFLDPTGFGVPVTAGAVSGTGILDQNSELILGGDVVMIDYLLTILTNEFGNLSYGDSIAIDGVYYKVEHEPMRVDDGTFSRIPLMKIAANQVPVQILDGDFL